MAIHIWQRCAEALLSQHARTAGFISGGDDLFLPSPLVGEGGAKRRMRGIYRRTDRKRLDRREIPLTRLAASRRATLSHKGRG